MQATDLSSLDSAMQRWFKALPRVASVQSPWVFLCLASLIDYLSAAASPNDDQWKRYPAFIATHFPRRYTTFRFISGARDLPTQMYYTLRNGLVHSFSLVPDARGRKYGGRPRSIVLAHRRNASRKKHLSRYSGDGTLDAAFFVAEDFLRDTKMAADALLRRAKRNATLRRAILKRLTDHPPIEWHR